MRVSAFRRRDSGVYIPNSGSSGVFSPAAIGGMQAWFKADSIIGKNDGDAISQWDDQSGNARHATQATGTKQPLYKTAIQNGLPIVRFDGIDDLLKTTAFTLNHPYTVFLVMKYRIAYASNSVVLDGDGVPGAILRTLSTTVSLYGGVIGSTLTTTPEAWHAYTAEFNNTLSNLRADGGTSAASTTSNSPSGGLTLGSDGTGAQSAAVDIGEVLIYNVLLSSTDRQADEAYLKTKWGTP